MNARLIRDERARTDLDRAGLESRMRGWLDDAYSAVLFERETRPVAYALYREDAHGVYLRQFFVQPEERRCGLGRAAVEALRADVWPQGARITLEVLRHNADGLAFWRAIGFTEYAITLESGGAQ